MRGLFINLESQPTRRRAMEEQISRLGLSKHYVRLEATDSRASNAARGCFDSHVRALRIALAENDLFHIVEDDVELSPAMSELIDSPTWTEESERFDLIFLDMWVDFDAIPRYIDASRKSRAASKVTLLDLNGLRIGSAASYLVKPRCIPRLLEGLQHELQQDQPRAIDATYGKLVQSGVVSAAVVVPFLTGQSAHAARSDIQNIPEELTELLLSIRAAFRTGQDGAVLLEKLKEQIGRTEGKYFPVRMARRALHALIDFVQSSK